MLISVLLAAHARCRARRALAFVLLLAAPTVSGAAQSPSAFVVRRLGRADGKTLLLIPGLFSSGAVWDGMAKHLDGRYDLRIFTLAGFAGVPPMAQERFFDVERDAIIQYIRTEHLDRPILVGHSIGGALALAVAAAAPDLVGPIVVVDAVPFLPALNNPASTADANRATADMMRAAYAASTPEQMAARSGPAFRGLMRDTTHLAEAIGWSARSDPATVGRAVADMMITDLRPSLPAIRSFVLVVAAGGDAATNVSVDATRAAYEAQVSGIPKHRVIVAAGARHFIMYDAPAFLFGSIDSFLEDISR